MRKRMKPIELFYNAPTEYERGLENYSYIRNDLLYKCYVGINSQRPRNPFYI